LAILIAGVTLCVGVSGEAPVRGCVWASTCLSRKKPLTSRTAINIENDTLLLTMYLLGEVTEVADRSALVTNARRAGRPAAKTTPFYCR